MKRVPIRLKLLLFAVGAAVACAVALFYYEGASRNMTPWQREQKIDFQKQTGSTKFEALIESMIAGGLAFCLTAIGATAAYKIYLKGKK